MPGCRVPAVRRQLADGVAALGQESPEALRVAHAPRKSTTHADDGNAIPRVVGYQRFVHHPSLSQKMWV